MTQILNGRVLGGVGATGVILDNAPVTVFGHAGAPVWWPDGDHVVAQGDALGSFEALTWAVGAGTVAELLMSGTPIGAANIILAGAGVIALSLQGGSFPTWSYSPTAPGSGWRTWTGIVALWVDQVTGDVLTRPAAGGNVSVWGPTNDGTVADRVLTLPDFTAISSTNGQVVYARTADGVIVSPDLTVTQVPGTQAFDPILVGTLVGTFLLYHTVDNRLYLHPVANSATGFRYDGETFGPSIEAVAAFDPAGHADGSLLRVAFGLDAGESTTLKLEFRTSSIGLVNPARTGGAPSGTAVKATPTTTTRRLYPHVTEISDFPTQQTARLLWDRVWALHDDLKNKQAQIDALTASHTALSATVTTVQTAAHEALAVSQQPQAATGTTDVGGATGPPGSQGGTTGSVFPQPYDALKNPNPSLGRTASYVSQMVAAAFAYYTSQHPGQQPEANQTYWLGVFWGDNTPDPGGSGDGWGPYWWDRIQASPGVPLGG